jgi:hypothetical protein
MYNIEKALENVVGLDRRDADCLADEIVDRIIIETLTRDHTLPARSWLDWEIALADVRQRLADRIHRRICGYVAKDEVQIALDEAAADMISAEKCDVEA